MAACHNHKMDVKEKHEKAYRLSELVRSIGSSLADGMFQKEIATELNLDIGFVPYSSLRHAIMICQKFGMFVPITSSSRSVV